MSAVESMLESETVSVSESETAKMMVYAAALPSIVCIVLHLWKFYQSASKQSLVTKNLTLYSFFLLLFTTFIISPSYYNEIYVYIQYLDVYLESATAFFKFIIVVQIFLYFYRNPYPQRPPSDSDSQNTEFRNYCILGFLIPLIYTIVLYSVPFFHQQLPYYEPYAVVFPTMKIIRIASLFPIFGTIWHLKSSGIDRAELLTKYPVETRLMLTIAAYSILLNLAQLIYWIFTIGSYTYEGSLIVTNEFENVAFAVEGIVIAILFTYRADTFKPVGPGESILAQ